MMPAAQLRELQPGNIVEAGGMLTGLSKEPVVWQVAATGKKEDGSDFVDFHLTWLGVPLGMMQARMEGEDVTWKKK